MGRGWSWAFLLLRRVGVPWRTSQTLENLSVRTAFPGPLMFFFFLCKPALFSPFLLDRGNRQILRTDCLGGGPGLSSWCASLGGGSSWGGWRGGRPQAFPWLGYQQRFLSVPWFLLRHMEVLSWAQGSEGGRGPLKRLNAQRVRTCLRDQCGCESLFCHLAVRLWATGITSLSLRFLICENGLTMVPASCIRQFL